MFLVSSLIGACGNLIIGILPCKYPTKNHKLSLFFTAKATAFSTISSIFSCSSSFSSFALSFRFSSICCIYGLISIFSSFLVYCSTVPCDKATRRQAMNLNKLRDPNTGQFALENPFSLGKPLSVRFPSRLNKELALFMPGASWRRKLGILIVIGLLNKGRCSEGFKEFLTNHPPSDW